MSRTKYLVITSMITIGFSISILTAVTSLLFSRNSNANVKGKFYASRPIETNNKDVALKLESFYTTRDVVDCFDTLLTNQNNKSRRIVFIGDSIVRNQFLTFVKVSVTEHLYNLIPSAILYAFDLFALK